MPEQKPENKATVEIDEKELLKDEQPEKPQTPLDRILATFKKARPASAPSASGSQRDLGKDKSKSLLIVVGSAVAVLLFFLMYFSSPQKPNHGQAPTHRGQPDLGQRTTPGQEQKQAGSVVPMLNADIRSQQTTGGGQVTPEDISRLSRVSSQSAVANPNLTANTLVPPEAKNPNSSPYALSHIDFSDPDLQRRYAQAGHSPHPGEATVPTPMYPSSNAEADLKMPSLVFVSSASAAVPNPAASLARGDNDLAKTEALEAQGMSLDSVLPAGTRLVARLESPASTAVAAPVVAAIEYNYERDGEIVVPAGSKALGKLDQANSSGYVSLQFNRIEFADGTAAKIDGTSMGLDFEPVKGLVSGRRRGARFLVQTLTGVGTVAAYVVGGNMSGPLSNGALLRENLADNVAIAGQNELNQVAFNQNMMVTVPGNTRFYIVFHETPNSSGQTPAARHANSASSSTGDAQAVPNLQELRQLLQLRQELSQLYQQEPGEKAVPDNSQPQ